MDPSGLFKVPTGRAPKRRRITTDADPGCVRPPLPPETPLSEFVEPFVNSVRREGSRPIYVREVSNRSKVRTLNEDEHTFLERYAPGLPKEFPYTSRVLLVLQETATGYAAFFVAYFQEYDGNCPMPNKNSVYLTMLDSANVSDQGCHKTQVMQSVLIGYMMYIGNRGFEYLFLWAQPPLNSTIEYVFPGRPTSQKTPDVSRLINWYKSMMAFAKAIRAISDYCTYHEWLTAQPGGVFSRVPVFEEDLIPSTLNAAAEAYKNFTASKRRSLGLRTYIRKEILDQVSKTSKDALYVVSLAKDYASSTSEILLEYERPSVVFDERDNLIGYLLENNLKFGDAKQAEVSTTAILVNLYAETYQNKYTFCDLCKESIIKGYICGICQLDVCEQCMRRGYTHEHPWTKRVSYWNLDILSRLNF